jgi:NADH:ubiquinone oxidoreductase subunit 2 (subunit N)
MTSIISAFYYLRIIKVMFFDKPINDIYINISAISKLIIIIALIISIFLIIFLSDFLEIINESLLVI